MRAKAGEGSASGFCLLALMHLLIFTLFLSGSADPACNGQVGTTHPLPVCSAKETAFKCAGGGIQAITVNGSTRHYCSYNDADAARLPLIVFMHGAGDSPDALAHTDLPKKALQPIFNGSTGFVLIAPLGRYLEWPRSGAGGCGMHWDFYHRNLKSPSDNPDVALVDALIDEYVSSGKVDPDKVFMTGWSNGGFFSQLYTVARFSLGTPKTDTKIRAASVFTAADPFNDIAFNHTPSCELQPYPKSQAPLMITSKDCDLICCNAKQPCPSSSPGYYVEEWVADAQKKMGNQIRWDLINAAGELVHECDDNPSTCNNVRAIANHIKWPLNREDEMLSFLNTHSQALTNEAALVV